MIKITLNDNIEVHCKELKDAFVLLEKLAAQTPKNITEMPDVNDLMYNLYKSEHKLEMIKRCRSITGCGLKEAKDFVENNMSTHLMLIGAISDTRQALDDIQAAPSLPIAKEIVSKLIYKLDAQIPRPGTPGTGTCEPGATSVPTAFVTV